MRIGTPAGACKRHHYIEAYAVNGYNVTTTQAQFVFSPTKNYFSMCYSLWEQVTMPKRKTSFDIVGHKVPTVPSPV